MPTAERRRRHNARLVREGFESVLRDPASSSADKLRAAEGLARLQARKDRVTRATEAAEAPKPPAPVEVDADTLAEIERRMTRGKEEARAAIGARKKYFEDHPDRAREVIAAIGAKEFLRITTPPE
jgi:hypothetical protein